MTSERFNNAYSALVDAFFNGTLAKGTCKACAVGNIVARGLNATITKKSSQFGTFFDCDKNNHFWKFIFSTSDLGIQSIAFGEFKILGELLEFLTGYTVTQLAIVEKAFECNTGIQYISYENFSEAVILEDQYKGLCAVVEVLLSFEEEPQNSEPYKEKFREHPALA